MGEIGELWRDVKADKMRYKEACLLRRRPIVKKLSKLGYNVWEYAPNQFRITKEGSRIKLDIFPLTLKYHNITGQRRGRIKSELTILNFVNSVFNN